MPLRSFFLLVGTAVLLTACSHTTYEFRSLESGGTAPQELGVTLPEPVTNADWPLADSSKGGSVPAADFSEKLVVAWKVDIGSGAGKGERLVAPVTHGDLLYALDAGYRLTAVDMRSGKKLWRFEPELPKGSSGDYGGGLAFFNGVLYVATGYGHVLAFDTIKRKLLWDKGYTYPLRSAPVVDEGKLYVVGNGDRTLAIDVKTGELLWSFQGIQQDIQLLGSGAPSVKDNFVFTGDSSGNVYGINILTGTPIYSVNIGTVKETPFLASRSAEAQIFSRLPTLKGVRARIVILPGNFLASAAAGNTMNVAVQTGSSLWARRVGTYSRMTVVGNILFLMDPSAVLWSISMAQGDVRWKVQFPEYRNEKKHKGAVLWTSPLMAGNHLWLVSSEGMMVGVDPIYGKIWKRLNLNRRVLLNPIVVRGAMYVLAEDATLLKLT